MNKKFTLTKSIVIKRVIIQNKIIGGNMKNVYKLILLFIFSIFICGCDNTGSLSNIEKENILNYLVNNKYIDEKCELKTDGIGEGELFLYYCDVIKNDNSYRLNVQQVSSSDKSRIFNITLYDDNLKIEDFELEISKSDNNIKRRL